MHLTVAVLSGNANETRYNLQSDYLQQTQIMPFTTIFKGDNNIHCILKNYNCLHLSSSYLSSTMLTKTFDWCTLINRGCVAQSRFFVWLITDMEFINSALL